MRIAVCTDLFLPQLSGVADSIDLVVGELRGGGHAVRVYAPRAAGADGDTDIRRLPAWPIPGTGGGMVIAFPVGVLADMRRFGPEIVHVHTFSTLGLFGLYAAWRLGVPCVGTDHTFPAAYLHYLRLDFAPARWIVRRGAAWFYDHCALVLAPSEAMIAELRAYGMRSPAVAISNPIPCDLFRPLDRRDGLKRRLGIGPEAVLVLGRVAAEKNLDLAVDIFAAVAQRRHAELVVVGDGPYHRALEEDLGRRGLLGRCRLLGVLHGERLVEAINACDVFLITSQSETQSMAMLQASACGLPVVAVKAGGLPGYVRDGQTGYLAEAGEPEKFVDRIVALLDDRQFARRLGLQGRELATSFSPAAIAARHLAVYRDLLAHRQAEAKPA